MDLISIITPTFNSSKYLNDTYLSIKNQSYSQWEWIVTDDCSVDDSWAMLQEISKNDSRVNISRNDQNCGGAITRNCSIDRAQGRYFAFIDSDDLWESKKLEKQVAFMSKERLFSFTAYDLIDKQGASLERTVDTSFTGSIGYQDMLRKSVTLGCSTVMLHHSLVEHLRMPNLRRGQDYAYWLSILRQGHRAHIFNEVLTHYRITPNSVSRNKLKKSIAQWNIYRRQENLSFGQSLFYFSLYARNAVFRKH